MLLAFALCAFGAVLTDTKSARIVQSTMAVVGFTGIACFILKP